MRRIACFVLLVLIPSLAVPLQAVGQDKIRKTTRLELSSYRTIHKILQMPMDMKDFQNQMTLKEFVGINIEKFHSLGMDLPIVVNGAAFHEVHPNEFPEISSVLEDTRVKFPAFIKTMDYDQVLKMALAHVETKDATFLIRAGRLEILPKGRATKEFLVNQTFVADFKNLPLEEALEELSDLSGATIILDARAKEKAQVPVWARFRNDVTVQDAVRFLAEMADLKLVQSPTGLFVTTPELAKNFSKN